jgi:hypothetical protein
MMHVRTLPPDNETEMKVSVFVSKTSACLKKCGNYTRKVYTSVRRMVSNFPQNC